MAPLPKAQPGGGAKTQIAAARRHAAAPITPKLATFKRSSLMRLAPPHWPRSLACETSAGGP